MLTKESIDALSLSKAQAIVAANDRGAAGTIVLPQDFNVYDLEQYAPLRRRSRGVMRTDSEQSFAKYVDKNKTDGTSVFVDRTNMQATAVLNLGTQKWAGHADDLAILKLHKTAPYAAFMETAGRYHKQRAFAEFIEDWVNYMAFEDESSTAIAAKKAVDAVRRVTVESARKVESTQKSLGTERSAFESVQVASPADRLPAIVTFLCEPYVGLSMRTFRARVCVRTEGNDAPMFTLQHIAHEEVEELMADEFASRVAAAISGVDVLLGSYNQSK